MPYVTEIITIDPGRSVSCDFCDLEFTDSDRPGGILFGSYATCPECAPKIERHAKRDGELHFIRARCPDGMPFADWVRDVLRRQA